ncbi:chromosome partitioning protein ParB [Fibrobacterales bacterium]|nr:chromosome partitioning protein ParB [Fibrobacterales bacterium]
MGKKSFSLGRGMGDILRDHSADINTASEQTASPAPAAVSLDLIDPNPFQPRKTFDENSLNELAESIKTHGILEPILLRKNAGRYQIVSGERRVRAARRAGLVQIENVRIFDILADKTMAEWAIIENVQRDDLNPIELSLSYQQLLEIYNYTHDELAVRLGKSRAAITNALRLLKLPQQVQTFIQEGKLSVGAARSLLSPNITDPVKAAEEIIEKELSVREVEEFTQQEGRSPKQKNNKKNDDNSDPDFQAFLTRLQTAFGTKIQAKPSRKNPQKGTLIIAYNSYDDLTRISNLIGH